MRALASEALKTAEDRAPCPECGAPMWLVSIEPAKHPGHDVRHFECVVCKRDVMQTVKFR
jgi:uncharacterized protein with PIN domain